MCPVRQWRSTRNIMERGSSVISGRNGGGNEFQVEGHYRWPTTLCKQINTTAIARINKPPLPPVPAPSIPSGTPQLIGGGAVPNQGAPPPGVGAPSGGAPAPPAGGAAQAPGGAAPAPGGAPPGPKGVPAPGGPAVPSGTTPAPLPSRPRQYRELAPLEYGFVSPNSGQYRIPSEAAALSETGGSAINEAYRAAATAPALPDAGATVFRIPSNTPALLPETPHLIRLASIPPLERQGVGSFPMLPTVRPKQTIHMGMLFSKDSSALRPYVGYQTSASAALIAIDRIRKEHLLDDYEFEFTIMFDECLERSAIGMGVEMLTSLDVDLIVGPTCNTPAIAVGVLASYYNLPVYLWGETTASTLGVQERFPTTSVLSPNSYMLGKAVQSLMEHYEWTEFALLYSTEGDADKCEYVQSDIQDAIGGSPKVFISYVGDLRGLETVNFKATLSLLRFRARIFVLCIPEINAAKRKFMLAAKDLGMLTDEFLYIFADMKTLGYKAITETGDYRDIWVDVNKPSDGRDLEALEAFQKTFVVSDLMNYGSYTDAVKQFEEQVIIRMADPPFNCTAGCSNEVYKRASTYSGQLHDAVLLYGYAANKTLGQGISLRNGSSILENADMTFEGVTGTVIISSNGTRMPYFYFVGLNQSNLQMNYARIFVQGQISSTFTSIITDTGAIFFANGGKLPLAVPLCDFDGSKCPASIWELYGVYIIIGIVVLSLAVLSLIIGIIYIIRARMLEEERLMLIWQIPSVQLQKVQINKKSVGKSKHSLHSDYSGSTALSQEDRLMENWKQGKFLLYIYEREKVLVVKHTGKPRIDKAECLEMRNMRQYENDNVNRFIGLSVDGQHYLSVWRLCSRGTLSEVLINSPIKMDAFFAFSLIRDVLSGLAFIHRTPVGLHGNLTSECCLVDERWQIKISLFGLQGIQAMDKKVKRDLLWTAPEILRDSSNPPTKASDIYSFAIISSEILMRSPPWDVDQRKERIDELIYMIKKGRHPPMRPEIDLTNMPDMNTSMVHLITDCWSENPLDRPPIDKVRASMRNIYHGNNNNLMDHVFHIMEQHAEMLEQEVDERTKELVEEKGKSDLLLYRMLPKTVADKLKVGQTVAPESFELVTIFFSDVVSFTTLAARCTPMQVVDILNGLYSIFDHVIETHDAYKVETIGDGYLCVSGLPKRNGNEHVKEIAEMSLELRKQVATFRIAHLPNEKVLLRIGLHTGSCVAGVVGLTMPRYCLFGDSVNTASRMESNGMANQIHMSGDCNNYLQSFYPGRFHTETRGDVIIKGKGVMQTYWLLGHSQDFVHAVYFLESIGGFYMTSAVVYIEKQFQIPSRLSGTMVSAGDFAYIPIVVFASYFGGKGNRARWIGAGCILIGIANLLIAASNFVFPVEEFNLDGKNVPVALAYETAIAQNRSGIVSFEEVLNRADTTGELTAAFAGKRYNHISAASPFASYQYLCFYKEGSTACRRITEILHPMVAVDEEVVAGVRILSSYPFAFCHAGLNRLRQKNNEIECAKDRSSTGPFLTIFTGLLILGVGRTMPFSLGLPLMDDNVKKQNLPVYFAGMFFVKILGPILGLLAGSVLNKIYVNFKPPQGLTPLDPAWIGCWWLGFMIFGLLLLGPSIALFLFPSDDMDVDAKDAEEPLNGAAPAKKQRRLILVDKHVRKKSDGQAFMPETMQDKFADFKKTLVAVLKSPIYTGSLLGRIVDVLAFKGFFVFLGKYMELQFGVPQHKIQKFMAGSGVVGFALGVGFGAFAMRKFRLQGRKAAAWVGVCSLMAACLSFLNAGVGCNSVLGDIGQQAMRTNNTFPSCRADCVCDTMPLYPVCNKEGKVFYSPCHAGCPLGGANFTLFAEKPANETLPVFNDCACAGTEDGEVSRSHCPVEQCEWQFKIYFANQAIGALFGGMGVVPAMLIILRSVAPEHRSVSLGINGFVVSLFATLPSPVMWGKLIDMSCIAWSTKCGETGACSLYDNEQLRLRLHFIYGGLRLISLFSDIWVFYWAKGLKLLDEEDVVTAEHTADNPPDLHAGEANGKRRTTPDEEARERKMTTEARELLQQLEEG
ncbi:unnamed protein product, partial [Mesorhabditis spiculigera]